MKHLVLASFASALLGGMSGTGLMLWLSRDGAPPPGASSADTANSPAELARRLDMLERTLASVETRLRSVPTALANTSGEPMPIEPAALGDPPVQLGSPVFEAAVLDVIDRSEQSRDARRSRAPEERRRRPGDWANELTMRLGLTPAQTDKLVAIQTELERDIERERQLSTENPSLSRDQRRAAFRAVRQRAEERLRGTLAPRQQAAYDQLDEKLKLYRSTDSD